MVYIISSGITSDGIILENDSMIISSGGTANSTTVNSWRYIIVSSGGTANGTTVNSWGNINVSSGGIANSTTVNSRGSMYVCGTANSTTVDLDGWLVVDSGGIANSTTVDQGNMYVYSGGTADSIVVKSWSNMYVYSGGTATNIVWTPCEGQVNIDDGAFATFASTYSGVYYGSSCRMLSNTVEMDSITLNRSEELRVMSGGTANDTTVNGNMYVSNGGIANSTTVNSMGSMYVFNGGTANSTIVNNNGRLVVYSGGTADNTTVNYMGSMYVSSGGTATNIVWTPCEGQVYIDAGAFATFASAYSGVYYGSNHRMLSHTVEMDSKTLGSSGEMYVMSGGTANTIDIYYSGTMNIFSGGLANCVNIAVWGAANVLSGGTANFATIYSGGALNISSGGTANFATIYSVGILNISSGALANSATVFSRGSARVLSGGTANDANADLNGSWYIYSGGTANNIIENGGLVEIEDGANVTFAPHSFSGFTISRAFATVHAGTTATDIAIGSGASMLVYSGGMATDIREDGGYLEIEDGAIVTFQSNTFSNVLLDWDESATVHSGTTAFNTTIGGGDPGCMMVVFSGGLAEGTIIRGGELKVYSGGSAGHTTLDGGIFNVMGATVIGVTHSYGVINISEGGFVDDIVLRGAYAPHDFGEDTITIWQMPIVNVSSGGTATGVKGMEGRIFVSSGGVVSGVEIGATYYSVTHTSGSGYYSRYEDEDTDDGTQVWVYNPGIHLSAGGKLTGRMTFSSGAKVYAESGSILDFDLTGTTAGATALVSDLSVVEGAPTYTLTVAGTQQNGLYRLADGLGSANTFDDGITALTVSGDQIGVLSVGQTFVSGGAEYLLTIADGSLTLSITQVVVPDKPVISVDVTTPTTGTVTVTAEFSGNSVTRQYSLDGETWIEYTGGIRFTENGAVSFRGLNVVGTPSEVATYEVKNIDHTPPEKPVAGADVTTPTNADVLVTATFGEDAVVREYSLDGENWCPYPGGIMFTSNRKAYFRSFDAAGNASEVAEYQVTNIDRTAPDKPVITVDVTEPTAQSVTVSAAFSDDTAVREYSFDGKEWLAYTQGVVCEGNETVSFRGTDAAGNVSQVALYAVQNIDATAPTDPTGLDAIVSGRKVALVWNAASDESSGVKEYVVTYSLNGQEITARTGSSNYVLTDAEFGSYTWSVQAVDFAGNESAVVAGEAFAVSQSQQSGPEPEPEVFSSAKGDVDGNGVSDVLFRWTGGDNQIGFWMNGRTQWQGQGRAHSSEWTVLGAHDMNADGKADVVMIGRASIVDMNGTYIGYYSGGVDTDDNWHTVGFLPDQGPSNAAWKNAVGNLTGAANANSVVWYSSNLYVVGVWTDGTDDWTVVSRDFGGADWTLVGCGDFDGDGKDSVVMSGANGAYFYTADLDGTVASMGAANWSGWDACAIGDFAGDGRDDMVLFHKQYGAIVMLADGCIDSYVSLGQLDPNDWFVVGAGDYDGDAKDDLLVRQNSTGMLGYYSAGDMAQWNTLGYGVDMSWTVIA